MERFLIAGIFTVVSAAASASTFTTSTIKGRFVGEVSSNQALYHASACLIDKKTGARLGKQTVLINSVSEAGDQLILTIKNGSLLPTDNLTADETGCIDWYSVTTNLKKEGCYSKTEIQLKRIVADRVSDDAVNLQIATNPADHKFTFAFDTREVSNDTLSSLTSLCSPR